MSALTPMKLGFPTLVIAATATAAATALANTKVQFVNFYNAGSSPVAVNSGPSTITVVFPTGTAQNCTIIPAGFMATFTKNNAADTHIATICAAGQTTTLYVQTGEGV